MQSETTEIRLKRQFLITLLLMLSISFSLIGGYAVSHSVWSFGIIYFMLVIINLGGILLLLFHDVLKVVIQTSFVYVIVSVCAIIFVAFLFQQNGSYIAWEWTGVVILTAVVVVGFKEAFLLGAALLIMFFLLMLYAENAHSDIIVELTEEQIKLYGSCVVYSCVIINLVALAFGWAIDKAKRVIEADKKQQSQEQIASRYEKYRTLYDNMINAFENDKIYTNPNLTMSECADIFNTNINYIYNAVKQHSGENSFIAFVNRYRIKAIKKMIENGDYERYTVAHLYQSVGFKYQSTFNKVFREIEGVTPTEFITRHKSKKRKNLG